jgi:thiol-disulfide isomerase/thioredoxin
MRILLSALLVASSIFAATPAVPRPAKEFTVVEANGKQSLFSNYKGKVIVAQFLFTTCPHCQALSTKLMKLQQEMGPNVQVVGIAFNDEVNPALAGAYAKQYANNFPLGYAKREAVMSYLGLSVMDRWVVPQVMIIDKKFTVRAQTDPMGTEQLQDTVYLKKFITDLLKEGAGAAPAVSAKPATTAAATGKKS